MPEDAAVGRSTMAATLGWRIRLVLTVAVTLAVAAFIGAAALPASAAAPASTCDTANYSYDVPARLSSPDTAPKDARGSPSGPEAVSWASPVSVARDVVAANTATEGYSSVARAKTALGSPGPGNVYDHVVEQSQIARSGFAPEQIHNRANLNPVSARVNQPKANYYSTKPDWAGGGTGRDSLNGQSFEYQHASGMQVTQDILGGRIGGAG